eukprot:TRINITY_DN4844_c0_g1_i2.p1 TRINITY_DN4844_c0_g1~~TRINITY_DN4844_c0_g1_i2.p1  ORF type:complete len:2293 (+),score=275.20 TRINITY_DN4844_c0_g1_i2:968-7846(+)
MSPSATGSPSPTQTLSQSSTNTGSHSLSSSESKSCSQSFSTLTQTLSLSPSGSLSSPSASVTGTDSKTPTQPTKSPTPTPSLSLSASFHSTTCSPTATTSNSISRSNSGSNTASLTPSNTASTVSTSQSWPSVSNSISQSQSPKSSSLTRTLTKSKTRSNSATTSSTATRTPTATSSFSTGTLSATLTASTSTSDTLSQSGSFTNTPSFSSTVSPTGTVSSTLRTTSSSTSLSSSLSLSQSTVSKSESISASVQTHSISVSSSTSGSPTTTNSMPSSTISSTETCLRTPSCTRTMTGSFRPTHTHTDTLTTSRPPTHSLSGTKPVTTSGSMASKSPTWSLRRSVSLTPTHTTTDLLVTESRSPSDSATQSCSNSNTGSSSQSYVPTHTDSAVVLTDTFSFTASVSLQSRTPSWSATRTATATEYAVTDTHSKTATATQTTLTVPPTESSTLTATSTDTSIATHSNSPTQTFTATRNPPRDNTSLPEARFAVRVATAGSCSAVLLDGTITTLSRDSPTAKYYWKLYQVDALFLTPASRAEFEATLQRGGPRLWLKQSALPTGGSLWLHLRVIDEFEQSSVQSQLVQFISEGRSLFLAFNHTVVLSTRAYEPLIVNASVYMAVCEDWDGLKPVRYQWNVTRPVSNDVAPFTSAGPVVGVVPYTFLSGRTYWLQLQTQPAQPEDTGYILGARITFVIVVPQSPLVAIIDGVIGSGVPRLTMAEFGRLQLNASSSYDPDVDPSLPLSHPRKATWRWAWSICKIIRTGCDAGQVPDLLRVTQTDPVYDALANEVFPFTAGQFRFNMTFTVGDSRLAYRALIVEFVSGSTPAVRIVWAVASDPYTSLVAAPVVAPPPSATVAAPAVYNVNTPLRLYGVSSSLGTFQWSVQYTNGQQLNFDVTDPAVAPYGNSSAPFELLASPSRWLLLFPFTITLTVVSDGLAGQASFGMGVNYPPRVGTLSVSPARPLRAFEPCTLVAKDWSDVEYVSVGLVANLTYSFFYVHPDFGQRIHIQTVYCVLATCIADFRMPAVVNNTALQLELEVRDEHGAMSSTTALAYVFASPITAAQLRGSLGILDSLIAQDLPAEAIVDWASDVVVLTAVQSGQAATSGLVSFTATYDAQLRSFRENVLESVLGALIDVAMRTEPYPLAGGNLTEHYVSLAPLVRRKLVLAASLAATTLVTDSPSPGEILATAERDAVMGEAMTALQVAFANRASTDPPLDSDAANQVLSAVNNALLYFGVGYWGNGSLPTPDIVSATLISFNEMPRNNSVDATVSIARDVLSRVAADIAATLTPGHQQCRTAGDAEPLVLCLKRLDLYTASWVPRPGEVEITAGTSERILATARLPADWWGGGNDRPVFSVSESPFAPTRVTVQLVYFANSPHFDTASHQAPVVELSARTTAGELIPVDEIANSLTATFTIGYTILDFREPFLCRYFDEPSQQWQTYGTKFSRVIPQPTEDYYLAECTTRHFTDFFVHSLLPTPVAQTESKAKSWFIVLILWGSYIVLVLLSVLLDQYRSVDPLLISRMRTIAADSLRGFGSAVAEQHYWLGWWWEHPTNTQCQRTTIVFSFVMAAFAINTAWRDSIPVIPAGLATAAILFLPIILLSWSYSHSAKVRPLTQSTAALRYIEKRAARLNIPMLRGPESPISPSGTENSVGHQKTAEAEGRQKETERHADQDNELPGGDPESPVQPATLPVLPLPPPQENPPPPPEVAVGVGTQQLVDAAMTDLQNGRLLTGVHLLVLGWRSRYPLAMPPYSVEQGKEEAARVLQVTQTEFEERFLQDEHSTVGWRRGMQLAIQDPPVPIDPSRQAFYAALVGTNPAIAPLIGLYSADMWVEYYRRSQVLPSVSQSWNSRRAEPYALSSSLVVSTGVSVASGGPSVPSPEHNRGGGMPLHDTHLLERWRTAIQDLRDSRNYYRAALEFLEVKNAAQRALGLPPKDLYFGRHWARYYASSLQPPELDFETAFESQRLEYEQAALRPELWPLALEEAKQPNESNQQLEGTQLPGMVDSEDAQKPAFVMVPIPSPMQSVPGTPRKVAPRAAQILYVSSAPATASSRYVPSGDIGSYSNPFRTLHEALEVVGRNSHIVLFEGSYPAADIRGIPPNVTISGIEGQYVVMTAHPAHPVVLTLTDVAHLTLANIHIVGPIGIEAVNSPNLLVRECVFNTMQPVTDDLRPYFNPAPGNVVQPQWLSFLNRQFPYGVNYVGHLLMALWLIGCTVVIVVVPIDWVAERRDRWLWSVLASFVFDAVVLQPIPTLFYWILALLFFQAAPQQPDEPKAEGRVSHGSTHH